MEEDYCLSARGFLSAEDVCAVIKELYDKRYDPSCNTQSWHYRQQVLRVAKKAFGRHFGDWVYRQIKSGYLYGRRLEFVLDTLGYIQGQSRTLSLTNWYELLEEDVRPDTMAQNARTLASLKKYPFSTTVNTLVHWCACEKGIEDMVCTLNILFGEHRSTDLPETRGAERLTFRLS